MEAVTFCDSCAWAHEVLQLLQLPLFSLPTLRPPCRKPELVFWQIRDEIEEGGEEEEKGGGGERKRERESMSKQATSR